MAETSHTQAPSIPNDVDLDLDIDDNKECPNDVDDDQDSMMLEQLTACVPTNERKSEESNDDPKVKYQLKEAIDLPTRSYDIPSKDLISKYHDVLISDHQFPRASFPIAGGIIHILFVVQEPVYFKHQFLRCDPEYVGMYCYLQIINEGLLDDELEMGLLFECGDSFICAYVALSSIMHTIWGNPRLFSLILVRRSEWKIKTRCHVRGLTLVPDRNLPIKPPLNPFEQYYGSSGLKKVNNKMIAKDLRNFAQFCRYHMVDLDWTNGLNDLADDITEFLSPHSVYQFKSLKEIQEYIRSINQFVEDSDVSVRNRIKKYAYIIKALIIIREKGWFYDHGFKGWYCMLFYTKYRLGSGAVQDFRIIMRSHFWDYTQFDPWLKQDVKQLQGCLISQNLPRFAKDLRCTSFQICNSPWWGVAQFFIALVDERNFLWKIYQYRNDHERLPRLLRESYAIYTRKVHKFYYYSEYLKRSQKLHAIYAAMCVERTALHYVLNFDQKANHWHFIQQFIAQKKCALLIRPSIDKKIDSFITILTSLINNNLLPSEK